MEDKMAAGAFGRARNYGWDSPFDYNTLQNLLEILEFLYSLLEYAYVYLLVFQHVKYIVY